jgi:orotate phosphoribosyltransferase
MWMTWGFTVTGFAVIVDRREKEVSQDMEKP